VANPGLAQPFEQQAFLGHRDNRPVGWHAQLDEAKLDARSRILQSLKTQATEALGIIQATETTKDTDENQTEHKNAVVCDAHRGSTDPSDRCNGSGFFGPEFTKRD
jgi:hypothetical protein